MNKPEKIFLVRGFNEKKGEIAIAIFSRICKLINGYHSYRYKIFYKGNFLILSYNNIKIREFALYNSKLMRMIHAEEENKNFDFLGMKLFKKI